MCNWFNAKIIDNADMAKHYYIFSEKRPKTRGNRTFQLLSIGFIFGLVPPTSQNPSLESQCYQGNLQ